VTESLHVPSSVVQRIGGVFRWLLPYITAGLVALAGLAYQWVESRVSRTEVSDLIAAVKTDLAAVRGDAFHGASMADSHQHQLAVLWSRVVAVEAELTVYREYGKADLAHRNRLVEQAKRFYTRAYAQQLAMHANDPEEAARLALLSEWRPE
jgi:hypothetical protein